MDYCLVAQLVKRPPAMRETWVRSLGWEDPLEKGKATHSSVEDFMDCIVRGVAKSWTRQSDFHFYFYMGYYSTIKKKEILPFVTMWMDLEFIMLNGVSQMEKDKFSMVSFICRI